MNSEHLAAIEWNILNNQPPLLGRSNTSRKPPCIVNVYLYRHCNCYTTASGLHCFLLGKQTLLLHLHASTVMDMHLLLRQMPTAFLSRAIEAIEQKLNGDSYLLPYVLTMGFREGFSLCLSPQRVCPRFLHISACGNRSVPRCFDFKGPSSMWLPPTVTWLCWLDPARAIGSKASQHAGK